MKFTLASCLSALAAVAIAKPMFTNNNFNVVQGEPFTLTWSNAKGPVTIELKSGNPPNGLKTVKTLATGVTGTSQTVTLNNLPSGQYAFTVSDGTTEDDTNYSSAFSLQGTSASISGSSSVASTSSAASSTTSPASSSITSSSSSSMTTMTARNSTTSTSSSSSSSSTATRSTPSASTPASSTPTSVPNNNSGGKVQSSLALVLLGAAAYVFLN